MSLTEILDLCFQDVNIEGAVFCIRCGSLVKSDMRATHLDEHTKLWRTYGPPDWARPKTER